MSYQVKTSIFEGPLDLLLQLITQHQVEITELSLTDLVAEYLGFLEIMQEMDLDVASEFLVIAATLIQLKARRLLPEDAEIDLDEELALAHERDHLLSRLLACLTFKDVAAVLGHRLEGSDRYVGRYAGLDPGVRPRPPELRFTVQPQDLAGLFRQAVERASKEPDLDHLDLDLPSVSDAIHDIRRRMRATLEEDFDRITEHCRSPVEVVAYFLAMLELVRWGVIEASQDEFLAPISVRRRTGSDHAAVFESEWSE